MIVYAVALGSNLGDRLATLRGAVAATEALGSVTAASRLYETEPVGGPEQGPYLNAVLLLETDLTPHDLLGRLNQIESEAGRERVERWGARTLDLDIVATSTGSVDSEDLVIPHPRAAEREFVLRPLCDVWPSALVGENLEAQRALDRLEPQGVDEVARRWVDDRPPRLGQVLVAVQFVWFVGIALALAYDGSLPDGSADGLRIVGGVVAAIGAGLAFISSRRLGPSLTALPEPRADGSLIESGPYGHARHPIYGGVVLFILGTSLVLDSLVGTMLSVGLLVFFYGKSIYEERQLRIRYPGYRAYRQRVRRRLIPFVI